jgi:hypothetical protein
MGQTLTDVTVGDDRIDFKTSNGKSYLMWHEQDCCESVRIESIKGDLNNLVGTPIVDVIEDISNDFPADIPTPEYRESDTFTTFTFMTAKGIVVIRWWGSSNGYYSESVNFQETT